MNVGSSEQNYRIVDIASIISETFPGCGLTVGISVSGVGWLGTQRKISLFPSPFVPKGSAVESNAPVSG